MSYRDQDSVLDHSGLLARMPTNEVPSSAGLGPAPNGADARVGSKRTTTDVSPWFGRDARPPTSGVSPIPAHPRTGQGPDTLEGPVRSSPIAMIPALDMVSLTRYLTPLAGDSA